MTTLEVLRQVRENIQAKAYFNMGDRFWDYVQDAVGGGDDYDLAETAIRKVCDNPTCDIEKQGSDGKAFALNFLDRAIAAESKGGEES